MKVRRPQGINYELESSGIKISAPAPGRDQMRDVYALDPAKRTVPMELSEQRSAQVEILLRGAVCIDPAGRSIALETALGALSAEEENTILLGLVALHHGIDPVDAVTTQAALRELIKKKARTNREKKS